MGREFHYVVRFDADEGTWDIEPDVYAYLGDGPVYERKVADRTGYGWRDVKPVEQGIFDDAESVLVAALRGMNEGGK